MPYVEGKLPLLPGPAIEAGLFCILWKQNASSKTPTLSKPVNHPRTTIMKRHLIHILSTLPLLLAFTACKQDAESKPKLKLASVERGDMTQTVVATGSIKPLHQIEIRSKTGGTVRKFFVEEGDWVTAGQRLFEIAPEASPSEQVRARGELRTAEVEVRQAEDDLRIAKELSDKNLLP
jgi:multidrug efflux pump subunit AcrA (membrane-fusion protein)